MGYYSYYTLSTQNGSMEDDEKIISELREENENANLCLTEDGYPEADITWYDHEEDLKEFSKKYPDLVLHLSVEGEENGDMSQKYFKNGKMQVCKAKIDFDDYDENKLK
jgi:hypothetical protein